MFEPLYLISRRAGTVAAVAGLLFYSAAAHANAAESSNAAAVGRINFDDANLPQANVELDLSQGMFGDLFGIGDAAVAGVAESLLKSAKGDHAETTRLAADQLAAVRQIIGLTGKVVREVRIRAFEKMADDLSSRFDKQIHDGAWEKTIVLRKGDENVRVFVIHRDESIRGVFVIVGGHGGQLLVNVVCDISPENVKNLTSAATKIGIDNGLEQVIEMKFRRPHGPMTQTLHPVLPPRHPNRRSATQHSQNANKPRSKPRRSTDRPIERGVLHCAPVRKENALRTAAVIAS